jgi:hypothetical protein
MKPSRLFSVTWMLLAGMVVYTSIAVADPLGPPGSRPNLGMKPGLHAALNNVVSMDAQGTRAALCLCGARFTVTPASPVVERDGTSFYLCGGPGDGRAQGNLASGEAEATRWNRAFRSTRMSSNARLKEGREVFTCSCGKTSVLNWKTPALVDNGLIVFCCDSECLSRFRSTDPMLRTAIELSLCLSLPERGSPGVDVTYLLPATSFLEGGDARGSVAITYRVTDPAAFNAPAPALR